MGSSKNILLVHGLWNRGWAMALMARRLRGHGHKVAVFSYPTRNDSLDGHADDLQAFILNMKLAELHLVGHSMGGLVILNMLSRYADLPAGRIVLMGTPVGGSRVVKRIEKVPGMKSLFGKVRADLRQGFQYTPGNRELGIIRGTRSLGLGRITGGHTGPNDGSVALSETQLEGLRDSVDIPVAHSEMLISTEVVNQAEQFILHGHFNHDD